MTEPIKNGGVSAGIELAKGHGSLGIRVSAKIGGQPNGEAFQQVNQNRGNNPQNPRATAHGRNADQPPSPRPAAPKQRGGEEGGNPGQTRRSQTPAGAKTTPHENNNRRAGQTNDNHQPAARRNNAKPETEPRTETPKTQPRGGDRDAGGANRNDKRGADRNHDEPRAARGNGNPTPTVPRGKTAAQNAPASRQNDVPDVKPGKSGDAPRGKTADAGDAANPRRGRFGDAANSGRGNAGIEINISLGERDGDHGGRMLGVSIGTQTHGRSGEPENPGLKLGLRLGVNVGGDPKSVPHNAPHGNEPANTAPQHNLPQNTSPHGNAPQHNLPPTATPAPNLELNHDLPHLETTRDLPLPQKIISDVLTSLLRQNDVYPSRSAVAVLTAAHEIIHQTPTPAPTLPGKPVELPKEVVNLVKIVGREVASQLDAGKPAQKLAYRITAEVSQNIRGQILAAKAQMLQTAALELKHFVQLTVGERMQAAIEIMPRHLPAEAGENLQNYKPQEVLNGMLLARGIIAADGAVSAESYQNLSRAVNIPADVSQAALRDVGQLVKVLIADAVGAKTTANLDSAVQKFVRILIANNELGVLLAAVNLAGQTGTSGGVMSRSLALVQIYELISRLVTAGEKAMNGAMPENSSKVFVQKTDKNLFVTIGSRDAVRRDETEAKNGRTSVVSGAESALRQFLEFNPNLAFDNSTSAFNNPEDARQAENVLIDVHHRDIEDWLRSGNHRFVKEIEFEKPVGIVVERNREESFTANRARIVLVRDGSVQGWHFLKSFLVA